MNQLKRLYSLILENPNDKMLGTKVRELYGTDAFKWDKLKSNITREQALNRLDYLQTDSAVLLQKRCSTLQMPKNK